MSDFSPVDTAGTPAFHSAVACAAFTGPAEPLLPRAAVRTRLLGERTIGTGSSLDAEIIEALSALDVYRAAPIERRASDANST